MAITNSHVQGGDRVKVLGDLVFFELLWELRPKRSAHIGVRFACTTDVTDPVPATMAALGPKGDECIISLFRTNRWGAVPEKASGSPLEGKMSPFGDRILLRGRLSWPVNSRGGLEGQALILFKVEQLVDFGS